MPTFSTYHLTGIFLTLDAEYLFTAATEKHSHCPLPWTWDISSWLMAAPVSQSHSSLLQWIGNTQQCPQEWQVSVFIPIPKRGNTKEYSNYYTVAFISCTSYLILKILQGRHQQYVIHELPDVQAGFGKGRETRGKIANICWISEKARELKKKKIHLSLLYWLCQRLWLYGSQITVENSKRDGDIRPPDLSLEKSGCRSESKS